MYSRLSLAPPRLARVALVALALTPSCKSKKDDAGPAQPVGATATAAWDGAAATPGPVASTTAPAVPIPDGPSFEGAITMRVSEFGTPVRTMTMLTKGTKMRVDVPTQRAEVTHAVFDPANGKALMIIDAQKMALTVNVPGAATAGVAQGLPPVVTRTGKHETIAGRDCEDWDVVEPIGNKHDQLCVTEGILFFDFTALSPAGSTGVSMGSWLAGLRDRREFPLRAVSLDHDGKEKMRMEVTKIEAKPLDAALFTTPAGYRNIDASRLGIQNAVTHPTMPR